MSAALAALRADQVRAPLEALLDVLRVPDHVHVQDVVLVEFVDDGLRGDAHGGDEELRAGLDDDVDQLAELAFGVVVAGLVSSGSCGDGEWGFTWSCVRRRRLAGGGGRRRRAHSCPSGSP